MASPEESDEPKVEEAASLAARERSAASTSALSSASTASALAWYDFTSADTDAAPRASASVGRTHSGSHGFSTTPSLRTCGGMMNAA